MKRAGKIPAPLQFSQLKTCQPGSYFEPPLGAGGIGPKTLGLAVAAGLVEPLVIFLVEPKFLFKEVVPSEAVALIMISLRMGSSVESRIFSMTLRVPALAFLA